MDRGLVAIAIQNAKNVYIEMMEMNIVLSVELTISIISIVKHKQVNAKIKKHAYHQNIFLTLKIPKSLLAYHVL